VRRASQRPRAALRGAEGGQRGTCRAQAAPSKSLKKAPQSARRKKGGSTPPSAARTPSGGNLAAPGAPAAQEQKEGALRAWKGGFWGDGRPPREIWGWGFAFPLFSGRGSEVSWSNQPNFPSEASTRSASEGRASGASLYRGPPLGGTLYYTVRPKIAET
jgi:hypothetical protein